MTVGQIIGLVIFLYILWLVIRVHRADKFVESIPDDAEISDNDIKPIKFVIELIFSFKPLKYENFFDNETVKNIKEAKENEEVI